jgi:arabinofuranosyltransferase
MLYFGDSLRHDPLTLCTIVGVLLWTLRPTRSDLAIAAGLTLYLAYVVRIGGDFMSGRFLAAPFFMAVLVFVHGGVPTWVSMRVAAMAAAFALVGIAPRSNFSGSDFGIGDRLRYIAASGISDERAFYYQWTGLLPVLHGAPIADTPWAREGRALAATGPRVVASRSVGLVGYYAGPTIHVVDVYALCDPLLSRLPSTDAWRIGHFERRLPDGYLETLSTGRNVIRDPGLAELYTKVVVLTRMPLFTRARRDAALELTVTGYDGLVSQWKSTARIPVPIQAVGVIK